MQLRQVRVKVKTSELIQNLRKVKNFKTAPNIETSNSALLIKNFLHEVQ